MSKNENLICQYMIQNRQNNLTKEPKLYFTVMMNLYFTISSYSRHYLQMYAFLHYRFQFSKKQMIKPEELEEQGIIMKKPGEVTLESEFNKIIAVSIEVIRYFIF